MTKEDKELLLKDLCGRLPYGVFCVGVTYELDDDGEKYIPVKVKDILTEIHNYKLETASVRLGLVSSCKLETVKPYLRPLSSMTKEEEAEWHDLMVTPLLENECESLSRANSLDIYEQLQHLHLEYLYKHHFDYLGLIPRGLAIEVTLEDNPYKDNKDEV